MTLVDVVRTLLLALSVYLGVGALVAVALHVRGLRTLDRGVVGAGPFFRALVTPGLVALWPLLLTRWRRAAGDAGSPGPDRPVSPEGLRRLHGVLVHALAALVPLVAGAAVALRPPPPAAAPLGLRELGQPSALGEVLAEIETPVAELDLDARVRGAGRRRQLELVAHADLGVPSLAAYWSAGDAEPSPAAATFLGTAWGPGTRRYRLPPEAAAGGRVLLHSLAHGNTLGSFALPATR